MKGIMDNFHAITFRQIVVVFVSWSMTFQPLAYARSETPRDVAVATTTQVENTGASTNSEANSNSSTVAQSKDKAAGSREPASIPSLDGEIIKSIIKPLTKGNKITLKEWFEKNKSHLDQETAKKFERGISLFGNELMPSVEYSEAKTPGGNGRIRLLFSKDKKTEFVDFWIKDNEQRATINGKSYNFEELTNSREFKSTFNPNILSANELKELIKRDKKAAQIYLTKLRNVVMTLETYQDVFFEQRGNIEKKSTKTSSYIDLILEYANAKEPKTWPVDPGVSCIVAGNLTQYGGIKGSTSCGHGDPNVSTYTSTVNGKEVTYTCPLGKAACKPLVYGFAGGPDSQCVSTGLKNGTDEQKKLDAEKVSEECNAKFPLPGNFDGYLKSLVANGISSDKEKWFADLSDYLEKAKGHCFSPNEVGYTNFEVRVSMLAAGGEKVEPYKETDFTNLHSNDDHRRHDRLACMLLMNRLIALQCMKDCLGKNPPMTSEQMSKNCGDKKAEIATTTLPEVEVIATVTSCPEGQTKCAANQDQCMTSEDCNKFGVVAPVETKQKSKSSIFSSPWFWGIAGLITGFFLGGCIAKWCRKEKKPKPQIITKEVTKTVTKEVIKEVPVQTPTEPPPKKAEEIQNKDNSKRSKFVK